MAFPPLPISPQRLQSLKCLYLCNPVSLWPNFFPVHWALLWYKWSWHQTLYYNFSMKRGRRTYQCLHVPSVFSVLSRSSWIWALTRGVLKVKPSLLCKMRCVSPGLPTEAAIRLSVFPFKSPDLHQETAEVTQGQGCTRRVKRGTSAVSRRYRFVW